MSKYSFLVVAHWYSNFYIIVLFFVASVFVILVLFFQITTFSNGKKGTILHFNDHIK